MNRNEIEKVLVKIFNEALNVQGLNYPVIIKLKDGSHFYGFKLLENCADYIIGFTKEEKEYAMTAPAYYGCTVIMKDCVEDIICTILDLRGLDLAIQTDK